MEKSSFSWWGLTKTLLLALGIAFLIRQFLFSPIVVDGPSMEPTLENRDYMIVNKLTYRLKEIKRFDIIVFHASEKKDYIKRVIGLPGEHIAYKDNVLLVDDKPVTEPFLEVESAINTNTEDFRLEELPEGYQTIPEGYVFVLGDNRTNSTDSRMIGLIPIDEIVGKTSITYWPLKRIQLF